MPRVVSGANWWANSLPNPYHDPKNGQFTSKSGGASGLAAGLEAERKKRSMTQSGEPLPKDPPQFIEREPMGQHRQLIKKRRENVTIHEATAEQFAYSYGNAAGKPFVLYEHTGRLATGQEGFNRTRFVAHESGLTQYNSEGLSVGGYPFGDGRKIRYWAGNPNRRK